MYLCSAVKLPVDDQDRRMTNLRALLFLYKNNLDIEFITLRVEQAMFPMFGVSFLYCG
jgi:hypothetical protein